MSVLETVAEGRVSQEVEGMRDLKDLRGITVLRVSCFGRMPLKTLSSCLICPSSLNTLSHSLSKNDTDTILVLCLDVIKCLRLIGQGVKRSYKLFKIYLMHLHGDLNVVLFI